MVDFNKISQAVQQEIKTISGMGGNKKKIDSADEFAALQQLGQRLETTGNVSEKEYVAGLMVEYQNQVEADNAEAAERRQRAEVTPAARKAVKELKKMMPNKKELDEPEARMLLDLIKNTRGDYNAADIEYFKQELIKAGFGELLNEIEDKAKTEPEQPKPATPDTSPEQPPKNEDGVGEPIDDKHTTEPSGQSPVTGGGEPVKSKPPVSGGDKPTKPNPPVGKNPPTPPQQSPVNPRTRIADTAKTHGERIARELNAEVERPGMSNNNRVHNLVQEVDKNTAYSFLVAYTYADGDNKLDVNQDIYGLSDMFNKISAQDAKHLVSVTLQQAQGMGLQNTKAYANLNQIFNSMNTTLHGKSDPDPALQRRLDQALTLMMNEMTRVVQ